LQQGDPAGARSEAEELIAKNPEDVRALKLITDSYLAQKQFSKAEERLKAAVAAHPQSAPLANFSGEWYVSAKNTVAARKAFEAAVAADPKFLPSLFGLANLEYQDKRVEIAVQRLQQVLAIEPKNVRALLMVGEIAGEMHQLEEAVRRYRDVLAVDGSNLVALNNLAYTLALSNPDEALKYAEQASTLAPENAAIQDTLGWIYYRKAVYSTAVRYLESAVSKEPTPRRQFHLAMSYMKAGNQELGQRTMLLALRQAPDLPKTEEGW
jgi:predicted Zn-dependent protease